MIETSSVVDSFLHAIETAEINGDLFADEVVLDATVPNWRFQVRGRDQVSAQLSEWFADLGRFESVRRERIADGEVVEFTLQWQENGVTHMCHQAHLLRIDGDRITADTAFCGGRWPASLIAEMAHA